MPNNRKVYQKGTSNREKISFLKFFFWPLYAISRQFKQCPHNIVSDTDVYFFRAGVNPTRSLFSFISLCRVRLCWRATGAAQRGSRQGRGLFARPPAFLHSIVILILALLFFFAGCCQAPQRKSLTDYEKERLRQEIILEFYKSWRLKQAEQEFLNRERNRDGKENISNKESGPGRGTRQGSISSQGAAERLEDMPQAEKQALTALLHTSGAEPPWPAAGSTSSNAGNRQYALWNLQKYLVLPLVRKGL